MIQIKKPITHHETKERWIMIHRGKELWDQSITKDMVETNISEGKETVWTYPELPKNMYEAFQKSADRLPGKTAIVDDLGKAYTYKEVKDKVIRFSAWLYQDFGVQREAHVALMLYNSVEFCVAFLALNRIGAVVIPLPTKFRQEEVCSLLDKSDVDSIVTDEGYQEYFSSYIEKGIPVCRVPSGDKGYGLAAYEREESPETTGAVQQVKASDLAVLMFTSGTTSRSKGVMIRNYNIMHAIVSYQRTLGICEEDRAIIPVPIYLITGLVAVFGLMMYVGGQVYLNKFFDAKRVLSDIQKYEVTFLHASPTVFTMLLKEKESFQELPGLRMFACGSSNMPPGKIRALKEWIPKCQFRTIYGLTETTSPGTVFPSDAGTSPYIGSSGIPIPGLEFKITDEDGVELEDGERGTVWVKGTNITESYYKMETTAIRNGWLDTGDIGYFNKEGYLYLVDRKKDMINRGGEKICSFDVENELLNMDGIADAAVVGMPDEVYGEVPVAVIRLETGASLSEEEIRAGLKKRIASYKVPKELKIVDRIPITENMKTDKKKIRKLFEKESER